MARKMATKVQVFKLVTENPRVIVDAIGLGGFNVQLTFPFDKKVSLCVEVREGFEDKMPKEIIVNIDGEELGIDFELVPWKQGRPLRKKGAVA